MKKVSGKVPVYKMYDKEGNLVDRGTANDLARKYYVDQSMIPYCARKNQWLLRQYRVEREPDPEIRVEQIELDERIIDLLGKGLSQKQMAERLGTSPTTISHHIIAMRKKGVIT